jgi:hypothetical protein
MMPILCLVASPRYRATGYGILNLFATGAGGAMIYVGGKLRDCDVNLSLMLQVAAGCLFACSLTILLVKPRFVDRGTDASDGTCEAANGEIGSPKLTQCSP